MGSVTEFKLGKTKSITNQVAWDASGKKVVEIDRKSDGRILTFTSTGHTYSAAQIIHQFEVSRHFKGTNGSGIGDASVAAPFGTITITPNTGLSNGDVIQLSVGYTGANSGPATVPYTIPAGTFVAGVTSFKGNFVHSGAHETPSGTAAEKEAEFGRLGIHVTTREFSDQNKLTELVLPNVQNFFPQAFALAPLTHLEIPSAVDIEDGAFWYTVSTQVLNIPHALKIGDKTFFSAKFTGLIAPLLTHIALRAFKSSKITRLNLPNLIEVGEDAFASSVLTYLNVPVVDHVGDGAFGLVANHSTTQIIMPRKFNTFGDKNRIFGGGNWNLISFTWV